MLLNIYMMSSWLAGLVTPSSLALHGMARGPRGTFPSLSLLGACPYKALRGGWTVLAFVVGFVYCPCDTDLVGAKDGADSRWEGGVGDLGRKIFAESFSEKDGACNVFESLTDDVLLRDGDSVYECHHEFEPCFRG